MSGIVCDGLLVIDCDTRNGVDDPATLALLFEAHCDSLPAAAVETGGGGLHCYFRMPDGCEGVGNSAGRLGAGVDVKTSGGMVVAPPSLHESGKRYWWLTGDGGVGMGEALPPGVPDVRRRRWCAGIWLLCAAPGRGPATTS